MRDKMKISVLGMGAYGIALGKVFYNNENKGFTLKIK